MNIKSPWLKTGPYTVFDLETSGMSPVHCRIIEIGAVRIDPDGVVSRYQTLVNPGVPLSLQIERLTGITNAMVASAPPFESVAADFLEFASSSRLVAHNARFDLSFLQESLARIPSGPRWEGGAYDTVRLAQKVFPGLPSYNLSHLKQSLGLGEFADGHAHRALYDAEITMELFCRIMKKLTEMC